MPHHPRDAQAALGHGALLVKIASMKVWVGRNRAAGHFVERNVFSGEVGRAGHHHRVAHALGVLQRPAQCLHAAQAAAHHGRKLGDAQCVKQAGLRIDPVFHCDHREIGAIDAAGVGVHVHGAGGAKAGAQVVHANDEKAVRVQRFARADHGVPPALALGLVLVHARHMVRGVECVADKHRIRPVRVERSIGLIGQRVAAQRRAAAQRQGGLEMHGLRRDYKTHGNKKPGVAKNEAGRDACGLSLAVFIKRPQATSKSAHWCNFSAGGRPMQALPNAPAPRAPAHKWQSAPADYPKAHAAGRRRARSRPGKRWLLR